MTLENIKYQLQDFKDTSEDVGRLKNLVKTLDDKIYYMNIQEEDYSKEMQDLTNNRILLSEAESMQLNIEKDLVDDLKHSIA